MKPLLAIALLLIAVMLFGTASIWSVLWFDMWTAQKKMDIKPIVINIERADYVSMVNGRRVEYDIQEGK